MKRKTGVKLGDKNLQQRRTPMKSPTRTFEITMKASHLFSSLYMTKYILDSETITSVVFDNSVRGLDVKEPGVDIPIKITVKV